MERQIHVYTDSGVPEAAICVVTTAAIDVHRPNISSDLFTVEVPMRLGSTGTSASITSGSASRSTVSSGTQACSESSQTLGSSPDCSTACDDAVDAGAGPQADLAPRQQVAHTMVQELLSSLSEEACLAQKGLDPVNLKLPGPVASPDLGHRLSVYNHRNQESLDVFQLKPLIDCPQGTPMLDEKYGALEPLEPRLGRVPEA
ncbi:PREDICTED: transmembrane protein C15orf27 homolog [Chlamydotis macqueenii]|uniref:transmembrane protein C15orf27 homolog n=1 Tax=Chlamydotis macqueenii TaxID=187382 RepID=UPI0005296468|nr:PREDICTED: transmembrane protein C15orf27 homolog [Chlamydotis macqueenii]